jgi:UDP-N-acetylmuramoylalanine--D-glutamate ligase
MRRASENLPPGPITCMARVSVHNVTGKIPARHGTELSLDGDGGHESNSNMKHRNPSPRVPSTQDSFGNQRVLVLGLGRFGGGTGVSRWLVQQGARVTVSDQADEASLADSIRSLSDLNIEYRLGAHDARDLDRVDWVVINPAVVKAKSPFFAEIQRRAIPWTTELNLFCERCPAPVIGVTGSYGKSTTGAMLHDILASSCRAGIGGYTGVHFGGNIGRSLLNDLARIRASDIVVLEMSNAQLKDLPRINWTPNIAVITNLHPHHLDRHGSYENYVRAKLSILQAEPTPGMKNQDKQPVILGDIDAGAASWLNNRLNPRIHRIIRVPAPDSRIPLGVPGWHNQLNAATARATAQVLGLNDEAVREYLGAFRGLPHRIELVESIAGVDYYNDSKSTSPSATIAALDCFDRPVVAIVGGQHRDEFSYEECSAAILAKCRAVVCTGASRNHISEVMARTIANCQRPCSIAIREAEQLEEAVTAARSLAQSGDVVLFSPGAPSFDSHANYSERGEAFCRLVRGMI